MEVNFDSYEQTTVICALVHYALHIYDPSEVIRCLDLVAPNPTVPWLDNITEGRAKWQGIEDTAVKAGERAMREDEVVAMRES